MTAERLISSMHTVGAFVIYRGKLAFMMGPNKTGDKIGIVRFGGHIENGETYQEALRRELKEEIQFTGNIIDSKKTYFIDEWDSSDFTFMNFEDNYPRPFAVKGNDNMSTALFIAKAEGELIPSAETHGIILLELADISMLCTESPNLNDFMNSGGEVIIGKTFNHSLPLQAGVHIRMLNNMLTKNIPLDKILIKHKQSDKTPRAT